MEIVECGEDSPVNLNKVNFKMIQMQTRLTDNTGAKEIMCVKVLGGSKRRFASIGDLIVASVKQTIPNSKIKKGSVVKAVIVRTKKAKKRADGSSIHFNNNAAVIINQKKEPFLILELGIVCFTEATIKSPILANLRLEPPKTLTHIISLAPVLSATVNLVCI